MQVFGGAGSSQTVFGEASSCEVKLYVHKQCWDNKQGCISFLTQNMIIHALHGYWVRAMMAHLAVSRWARLSWQVADWQVTCKKTDSCIQAIFLSQIQDQFSVTFLLMDVLGVCAEIVYFFICCYYTCMSWCVAKLHLEKCIWTWQELTCVCFLFVFFHQLYLRLHVLWEEYDSLFAVQQKQTLV